MQEVVSITKQPLVFRNHPIESINPFRLFAFVIYLTISGFRFKKTQALKNKNHSKNKINPLSLNADEQSIWQV